MPPPTMTAGGPISLIIAMYPGCTQRAPKQKIAALGKLFRKESASRVGLVITLGSNQQRVILVQKVHKRLAGFLVHLHDIGLLSWQSRLFFTNRRAGLLASTKIYRAILGENQGGASATLCKAIKEMVDWKKAISYQPSAIEGPQ